MIYLTKTNTIKSRIENNTFFLNLLTDHYIRIIGFPKPYTDNSTVSELANVTFYGFLFTHLSGSTLMYNIV